MLKRESFQVTQIRPNQVYSAIGDTLQSVAQAIENFSPAQTATNSVRQGFNEFRSLLFR